MTANVKSMCYFGEVPWHGLGTRLDNPATAAEAIRSAGLDYQVAKEPVFTAAGIRVPDRFATVRTDLSMTDPNRVLGCVGERYEPVQNRDAFSFFDNLVGQNAAIYHTAGCLGRGEKIWLLAKLPGQIVVTKEDVTDKFLLLTNSHDGSFCLHVKFTPIRVVCQNTLSVALRGQESTIRIKHTASAPAQLEIAGKLLASAQHSFEELGEAFRVMARADMKQAQLDKFLNDLVPDNPQAESNMRTQLIRDRIRCLFEVGKGNNLPGVRGTRYAAFNAATEFIDHYRSPNADQSAKLDSIWFGSGAKFKQRAFELAYSYALIN